MTTTNTPEAIDMTPSWGDVGMLHKRLVVSREYKALIAFQPEVARAFAMAQALNDLMPSLTEEQRTTLSKGIVAGLTAQGY